MVLSTEMQKEIPIPMDRLFFWHASMKTFVMFPLIEQKLGHENYKDLCNVVLDLEKYIGVIKGDPEFEAG